MPRFDTTDTAALDSQVASYLNELPAETTSLYHIWYEQLGGYGVPTPEDLVRIEEALDKLGGWTSIGKAPDERYGAVPKWKRDSGVGSTYDAKGNIRVQHKFKVGGIYKAPDGTQYKIALAEVYNLRGFEIKDGQLVGPMIKINPESELADSLVEA